MKSPSNAIKQLVPVTAQFSKSLTAAFSYQIPSQIVCENKVKLLDHDTTLSFEMIP